MLGHFDARDSPQNLRPRRTADAGKRSRKDGQFHGAGHKKRASEGYCDHSHAALLDTDFASVGHGLGRAISTPENPNK